MTFNICNFYNTFLLDPPKSWAWRRRICFAIPTRSSSTLCFNTQEVSINLQSNAMAISFPSESWISLCKWAYTTFYAKFKINLTLKRHRPWSLQVNFVRDQNCGSFISALRTGQVLENVTSCYEAVPVINGVNNNAGMRVICCQNIFYLKLSH